MKAFYDNDFRMGILGGGQLGKMLIQSAMNFGIKTAVLDPDKHAPCRYFSHHFVHGSFTDYHTVYTFGKNVDLLTIEIENVNTKALQQLKSEGISVFPQPDVVALIQDKGLQKTFLRDNNIPTADFVLTKHRVEVEHYKEFLPAVHKLRRSGYDGRGVVKLQSASDLSKAFDAPAVLEKMVDIEKEISVIVARNFSGTSSAFPVCEMSFHPTAHLVELLICPAQISHTVAAQANQIALTVAERLRIVGLLAVEMFVTQGGEVLVNELAPRPHNSGHHTIEACVTSQYEQCLRAILNLPLGSTELIAPAVMINLLGEAGHEGTATYQGINDILTLENVYLHLYGKRLTKPFRKMGHVTILDKSIDQAIKKARFIKEKFKVISM